MPPAPAAAPADKRAWAVVDSSAVRDNLARVRALYPSGPIMAVVKADAYGHGMERTAAALAGAETTVAAFGVATLDEAVALREIEPSRPIVLLGGFVGEEELRLCLARRIEPVVHAGHQVALLTRRRSDWAGGRLWLKLDTGMNRLGMAMDEAAAAFDRLRRLSGASVMLMSHLARADDPCDAECARFTDLQLRRLLELRARIAIDGRPDPGCTMASSAAILTRPDAHLDCVRPGIMLYGSSPLAGRSAAELGLRGAMTLRSRLVAVRDLAPGERVGYGGAWTCERATRLGVVSIGYGDGYPRSARNGAPVVAHTRAGPVRVRLAGRVSMDMLTVDLAGAEAAAAGDAVTLWGGELDADEVAGHCGTIAYELFCRAARRVPFESV